MMFPKEFFFLTTFSVIASRSCRICSKSSLSSTTSSSDGDVISGAALMSLKIMGRSTK